MTTKYLDNPENNDNRNYDYTNYQYTERWEYPIINNFITKNSKVVDLGCGNGSLLRYIKNKKKIDEVGIEISDSGIVACKKNKIIARLGKIDDKITYEDYNENEFDFAICNVTMQMVMYPDVLLKEMKRIARYQIISFPNFAFYLNRIDLLLNGRMPKPMLFKYKWYSTGHVHQLSLKDFEEIIKDTGELKIEKIIYDNQKHNIIKRKLCELFPNLFCGTVIYILKDLYENN